MSESNFPDRLFVYGTLRKTDPSGQSALLGPTKWVGVGKIQGLLFHLGKYPGAVPSEKDDRFVIGEVYQLADFASQITLLDRYEGCDEATPQPHEYRRAITTVTLEDGQKITAWIYWYLGDVATRKSLASGDWLVA